MRKSLLILLCAVLLSGCTSVPESVKDADALAVKLDLHFTDKVEDLLVTAVGKFSSEAKAHIRFRADMARQMKVPEEKIKKFEKEMFAKVDAVALKMISKYKELKSDFKKSLKLRKEVSEYLKNRASTQDLIRALGESDE